MTTENPDNPHPDGVVDPNVATSNDGSVAITLRLYPGQQKFTAEFPDQCDHIMILGMLEMAKAQFMALQQRMQAQAALAEADRRILRLPHNGNGPRLGDLGPLHR